MAHGAFLFRYALTFAAALAVALLAVSGATAQDKQVDANFKAQVAAGWTKLAESDSAATSYTVEYEYGRTMPPEMKGRSFKREERFRIRKGPKGVLIEGPRSLQAGNSDYRFELKRDDATSPWSVGSVRENRPDELGYRQLLDDRKQAAFLYPVSFYLQTSGPQLLAALKSGTLKLSSRRETPAGTVVVAFRLKMPNELRDPKVFEKEAARIEQLPEKYREKARVVLRDRAKPIVHVGEMTLDPALDYAIVAASSELEENSSRKMVMERKLRWEKTSASSVVRCDSFHLSENYKKEGISTWDSLRVIELSNAAIPMTEFYLSHYGFPEPLGVSPPPARSRWLYLLAGAVGLLVLSVGLRFVWRRRVAAKVV